MYDSSWSVKVRLNEVGGKYKYRVIASFTSVELDFGSLGGIVHTYLSKSQYDFVTFLISVGPLTPYSRFSNCSDQFYVK